MEGGWGCGVGSCTVGAVGGWEDERRQRTPPASLALRTRRQFSLLLLLQAASPRAAPKPQQAWGRGDGPGPREKPAQVSTASPLGAARGRVLFRSPGRDSVLEQGRQTPMAGSQRYPSLCPLRRVHASLCSQPRRGCQGPRVRSRGATWGETRRVTETQRETQRPPETRWGQTARLPASGSSPRCPPGGAVPLPGPSSPPPTARYPGLPPLGPWKLPQPPRALPASQPPRPGSSPAPSVWLSFPRSGA